MREEIEAKAASLVVRLAEASDAEHAEIMAWVEQSPAHAVAFARAESAWKDAERLKAIPFDQLPDDGVPPEEPVVPDDTEDRSVSRRGLILAGVAGLALATGVPAALLLRPHGQSFTTQRGEVREVQLADGSTLHINTDSKLEVAYGDDRRLIRLLAGEASFDVAHDKARPFDVEAGDTVTRAVGTRFTVRRHETGDIELTVSEGIVSIRGGGGQEARVAAGNGARFASGTLTASALDEGVIQQRTAWQDKVLEFNGLTIGEAVAEFNRYRRTPILIADRKIAAERIGGRFGLAESDQFLDALQSGYNVTVVRRADGAVEITGAR